MLVPRAEPKMELLELSRSRYGIRLLGQPTGQNLVTQKD
jgi:hypothetical protein